MSRPRSCAASTQPSARVGARPAEHRRSPSASPCSTAVPSRPDAHAVARITMAKKRRMSASIDQLVTGYVRQVRASFLRRHPATQGTPRDRHRRRPCPRRGVQKVSSVCPHEPTRRLCCGAQVLKFQRVATCADLTLKSRHASGSCGLNTRGGSSPPFRIQIFRDLRARGSFAIPRAAPTVTVSVTIALTAAASRRRAASSRSPSLTIL
jgi:hypothetical protein